MVRLILTIAITVASTAAAVAADCPADRPHSVTVRTMNTTVPAVVCLPQLACRKDGICEYTQGECGFSFPQYTTSEECLSDAEYAAARSRPMPLSIEIGEGGNLNAR